MAVLKGLGLDAVFGHFEKMCAIPHGSTNEKELSDNLVKFAEEKGLYCRQDKAYNVLIKKPATKGYEHAEPVILQGHIDMVCEKEADVEHDFLKEGLKLIVDGDFIRADGTTLGADNGIAAAYMLAILEDDTMVHPPIEAIFTVEEEIGMGGAQAFDPIDIESKRMINIDTEEEGYLLVSCSGGRRMQVALPLGWQEIPSADDKAYEITVTGLIGGHSGQEIHLQRANANCLMGRVLSALEKEAQFSLASVDGGRLDNVICRETKAVITCSESQLNAIKKVVSFVANIVKEEYKPVDPSITISIEPIENTVEKVFTQDEKKSLIQILLLLPYGVQTMSMEMPGLVESSTNIGVVKTTDTQVEIENAIRSAVTSRKELICQRIEEVATLCGAKATGAHDYPGWKFDTESELLKILKEVYLDTTGKEAEVSAVHAGLECGLFGEKIPGLDMISIGPDMFDVHTPKERVSISSTIRTWDFIKAVLLKLAQ